MSVAPVPVVILGATGMVGQRMLQRLEHHPFLQVAALTASQRSAGRTYGEAATWRLSGEVPENARGRVIRSTSPDQVPGGVRVALSALDGKIAGPIEETFRAAGFAVITNASAWRMDPLVPLVIPEVNPHHLTLLDAQAELHGGFIVANPNCCAVPLAMAMAPLHQRWGVEALTVATYQAVSGAGYPGESAWDMVGSVHPHAGQEETKLALEPQKILGSAGASATFAISARCVRVPVADGHLLAVHVRLRGNPSPEAVAACLREWAPAGPLLPSCPRPPLRVLTERHRPNVRLDVDAGDGMVVTIGRVESCAVMGTKLFVLGHNTLRGAAGAAIANAELLALTGRI